MKTGQTTSYRTGDDGDLERGRNVSFMVLAENNPFGNTNRFTDELGGQTYTNNIVIDWSTYDGSTVLGWRRTQTGATWNNAIDGAQLVSIPPYTSGWRLPNVQELFSVQNFANATTMNYAPFNLTSGSKWTSTTAAFLTTQAFYFTDTSGFTAAAKTTALQYLPCRTFTVTGTTLS
jgi:hypothetical protein